MFQRNFGRGRPSNAPAAFIHPKSANRRQAAAIWTGLGARAEARRLSAANPCARWRASHRSVNGAGKAQGASSRDLSKPQGSGRPRAPLMERFSQTQSGTYLWCGSFGWCLRICSSTNRRIAEDRLPCWRVWSICVTNFDSVACWLQAISFSSLQKASSRLMLVLCPPMMMERLITGDFIRAPVAPRPFIH